MTRDWREWHRAYDQPDSRLHRRLAVVQDCVSAALDAQPPGSIRVISMCAGEGRDLLEVLAVHPRAGDVTARLVELDEDLAAVAASHAPPGVDVVRGDAALTTAYDGAVPAHVVLVCGVFGNIPDADIEHTIGWLPALCAPGATVIWTRHRRPPDRTEDARRWLLRAGFEEVRFTGDPEHHFGVGMHRLTGDPQPYVRDVRLFTFVGYDALR